MVKSFGSKTDGEIITVNEEKLNLDYIQQIRNYLDVQEKRVRNLKKNK